MSTSTEESFTLLCVDDEANILSSLRRLFRPHGYKVLVAGGGAEGLEMLSQEHVDLIISDMRMPGWTAPPSWPRPAAAIRTRCACS